MLSLQINTIGLIFNIIGFLLLFKYSLPSEISKKGSQNSRLQDENNDDIVRWKKYNKWYRFGLILIILGFGLQILSNFKSKQELEEFSNSTNEKLDNISNLKFQIDTLRKQLNSKEVFGFLPYWREHSYENFDYDIITSLSYYSYEINPKTGVYKNLRDWKSSKVIDLALKINIKVYLSVSSSEKHDSIEFLNNSTAQNTSIDSITALVSNRKAQGITISFDNIPPSLKNNYTDYVRQLSNKLKSQGKKIALTLPSNKSEAYDIPSLNPYVDYFIIMTNNYYDKQDEDNGPVAPLNSYNGSKKNSIKHTLEGYLLSGIPNNKLILTLPYYGTEWLIQNDSTNNKRNLLVQHLTYQEIKKKYVGKKVKYDSVCQSAYYDIIENDRHTKVWFDDQKTLAIKYDVINEYDLGGVAIWALGFDDGSSELWEVLRNKFN